MSPAGVFLFCGTGRQPIQRDKTINDNYYLLTLAALAREIRSRGALTECTVRIAAGLPLTSYGRDKPKFRSYLFRPSQPVQFRYEGVEYSITIADVQLFPQGFAALMAEPDLLTDEPSLLLMDIGGWTVDLMRIDNALPVAETAHSLELGMIRCIDEVRERVRQETGLSLTDAQIEQSPGRPALQPFGRGAQHRKQTGAAVYRAVVLRGYGSGLDLHAMPLVMLGGGACIVNRHVSPKDGLCRVIPLLDDRVNAIGFERALGRVQGAVSEGVKRPQFVFRPTLSNPDHRKAWGKTTRNTKRPAQGLLGESNSSRDGNRAAQKGNSTGAARRIDFQRRQNRQLHTDCGERGTQTNAGFFGIALRLTDQSPLLLMMYF